MRRRVWLAVAAIVSAGCPSETPITPSPDLSIVYSVEPVGTQLISPGQTLTLRVVVDSKGVLNAGVEFETVNVPDGITATLNPARISETARETQLVVQAAPTVRPGDYDFRLNARLTVSGQLSPQSTSALVPLRVPATDADFTLSCAAELAIPAGAARTLTCRTIRQAGFNAIIDLSFQNRPAYIMLYPETASVGPDTGGFAFTAVRSLEGTTPAFYDLVGVGRSGTLTRQSTVRLFFP